jgi:hypothetical protein
MPWPSLVVFSGRGMHFYWCTTHTPAPALPVWQAIQKRLIDCLADVGADRLARDCARVLRLVGTVNSKVNEEVRGLVLDAAPWKFHDLANEVLGDRIDGRKKNVVRSLPAAQIRAGNHPKATTFRRWHLVFRDLGVIGSHYGSIPEGSRNEFLFIAGVALSWFAAPESIEDEVADFARLYCSRLDASEAISAASQSVARATKAAAGGKVLFHGEERDPRYFFKRSTLWDRLGDLASPIKDNLRAIIPDELAEEREGERQRCRDRVVEGRYSSHYTGEGVRSINIEKRAQALILKANGVGVREIARHLAVSHPTVRKWLGGN